MPYHAIVFDWDGTLVQTSELIMKAHNHVRSHFGLEPWKNTELKRGNQSARELYPAIYGKDSVKAQDLLYAFFKEHHLKDLKPYADSERALKTLKARNIPMGVASNKRHTFLVREIQHLGWGSYFQSIVGAGEAPRDKPAPDPLLLATKNLDHALETQNILYVGDTETDLKCAAAARCPAALILRGRTLDDLIATYRPVHVADTLNDLEENIRKN